MADKLDITLTAKTPAAAKPLAMREEMEEMPSRENGDDHHRRLRKSPPGRG